MWARHDNAESSLEWSQRGVASLTWDTVVFVVAKQSACGVVLDIAEVGEVFALSAGLDKVLPAYVLQ